jgi:antirestriction protein ArdC
MKTTVQEIIVKGMIEALENGVVPWQKPWNSRESAFKNLMSKKPYRGVNVLALSVLGGGDEFYLTFNQIKAKGGTLIKGTKGIPISFYTMVDKKDGTGKFPLHRYYLVFPASQVEGIKLPEKPKSEDAKEFLPIPFCDQMVTAAAVCPVNHGGNRACFTPALNKISMPNPEDFSSPSHYYATLFHEIGHALALPATGENLSKNGSFGSDPYAKEELVAEIFSCFCLSYVGIMEDGLFTNGKAYVASWATKLKSDPSLVIQAASQAQKRFDYFLEKAGQVQPVTVKDEEEGENV